MDWNEIASTTWGAVQGSIAVLLIIAYGYFARSQGLLSRTGERNISALITKLFLPALLFKGIGPSATASTIVKYWTIIAWAVIVQTISYLYALICLKFGIFNSGLWTGACMFNNTISLPLLMLQSLGRAGAFDSIIEKGGVDGAIQRSQTYFLVNALVNHLTSYIFGPRIMSNSVSDPKSPSPSSSTPDPHSDAEFLAEELSEPVNERTHLLLGPPQEGRHFLHALWAWLRRNMNPPLLGGLTAILVGIIPTLHSMFLDEGGILRGSLTQSIYNIGDLYTAVQLLVVGAQLFSSSQLRRREGGHVSKISLLALFLLRFLLMPAISISFIHGIRLWLPHLIPHDPMFDYSLMMIPVGPPAIHLAAIAELAEFSEGGKGVLSNVLMLSYVVTPLISVPIAAALAVIKNEGITYRNL